MLIKNFVQDRRASVAPIFGITVLTLVSATGAAVDYSRAGAARAAVQNALDATGLMLSKNAEGLSPEELNLRANAYFQGAFTSKSSQSEMDETPMPPGMEQEGEAAGGITHDYAEAERRITKLVTKLNLHDPKLDTAIESGTNIAEEELQAAKGEVDKTAGKLAGDIENMVALIRSGKIIGEVEKAVGELDLARIA